jgi:hypothetical protein
MVRLGSGMRGAELWQPGNKSMLKSSRHGENQRPRMAARPGVA